MPLPPELDAKISATLSALIQEATELADKMDRTERAERSAASSRGISILHELTVEQTNFERVRTRVLSLLALLTENAPHLQDVSERVRQMKSVPSSMDQIVGILQGIQADYEDGLLDRLSRLIEDEVIADYLTMAEQLLAGGPIDKRYIPAAVLGGAVLEDGLRRLCQRQQSPIPTVKDNGEPKLLNRLIDDLKVAGVYNELKAKQLRAWADIRNAAAHGRFEEFNEQDVARMLQGISQFLADYL